MVPTKPPNKAGKPVAEAVEGRGPAKRNSNPQTTLRTQGREGVRSARARVRQAVKKDRTKRLTTLFHHIANVDSLREAYYSLKRQAAPGADGTTWEQYGRELEANLQDLSGRLKRGAYRAKPVRRTYIPKADGKQRPLGVTALEDKLVQLATVEVLNVVYEADFKGFSYGFRPGRGQHNALDALAVGLDGRKVNWVLDADIRGFFDNIDHGWLVKFVEHRIADKRVVRLIQKWLRAGVLEDGKVTQVEVGTPQGGNISPLLANIYLHYALDLWFHAWRRQKDGDVIVVRYADDFVMGFQHKADAERLLLELRERLAKFKLELHPDKTRLIEFGRFAATARGLRGQRKPETFDFLGFTHTCGTTRGGKYKVQRTTALKKLRAKLQVVKAELKERMHDPIPKTGKWLGTVVKGHVQYYGVPGNTRALRAFRDQVTRYWHKSLRRRGQRKPITWARMSGHAKAWIPPARVTHPYPDKRLRVTTRGRSPVR
jgi:group II intron reverse transcriptase/maturase